MRLVDRASQNVGVVSDGQRMKPRCTGEGNTEEENLKTFAHVLSLVKTGAERKGRVNSPWVNLQQTRFKKKFVPSMSVGEVAYFFIARSGAGTLDPLSSFPTKSIQIHIPLSS